VFWIGYRMSNKKISLKRISLLGFIVSFIVFNSILFIGEYELTESIIDAKVSKKEINESLKNQSESYNKRYHSKFEFLSLLDKLLDQANQDVQNKYKITATEFSQLLEIIEEAKPHALSPLYIDSIFQNDPFKNSQFKSYSSWIHNKEFESYDVLKDHLSNTKKSINESIIYSKGLSSYEKNDLKFKLIKSSIVGTLSNSNGLWIFLSIVLTVFFAILYFLPNMNKIPGIKNDKIFQSSTTSKGSVGIILGSYMIGFYILLYEFPYYIPEWVRLVDPISYFMNGSEASQWFFYGFLYTLAILVMGVRMIIKYRHNKYQMIRTISVMFFQSTIAFILVQVLQSLNLPAYDLKNIWPLDYSFFFDYRLNDLMANGTIGFFMLGWGIALFMIGVPVLSYFFGKRWYCSWVCGCGGLAETLGDPFRQLSDKSLKSWQIERYLIHSVLVFAVVMTVAVIYSYITDSYQFLGLESHQLRSSYGFLIGSVFSGIVGTGFYPLMGNRVWCRFGCPLAAYLGLVQRFKSRFRITTNGGQCISCGNCSTYCEMGIDVRWYAQRGQDIVRSSCVGCGICSAVCPRGVLKLENGTVELDLETVELG
jgi:ferredoxin-type protein NapH